MLLKAAMPFNFSSPEYLNPHKRRKNLVSPVSRASPAHMNSPLERMKNFSVSANKIKMRKWGLCFQNEKLLKSGAKLSCSQSLKRLELEKHFWEDLNVLKAVLPNFFLICLYIGKTGGNSVTRLWQLYDWLKYCDSHIALPHLLRSHLLLSFLLF